LNFGGDLYVCFSKTEGLFSHGNLGLAEYAVSVLKANAFAYFDWRDPWPAIKELAALVGKVTPRAFATGWNRT
jgi:hypothetical protein